MLSNWLSPISSDQVNNYFSDSFSCQGNFPDLQAAKIVVFSKVHGFSASVRRSIGLLHNHFDVSFVDIGNLNVDSATAIYQVISELQDGYILPVLIGVDYVSFVEFCSAMQIEGKLQNCAFVSNRIHLAVDDYDVENIGFQRHAIPKFQFLELDEMKTSGLSLGNLRSNGKIIEPILRESNYLHFDLAAIRMSDAPAVKTALPTGLHAAEACQIMRYAGEGMRLKLVTFDCYDLDESNAAEAMLVAELLWYLHEGVSNRCEDHPSLSSNFKEYIIELNEIDHSLTFCQSTKTGKWWMKLDNKSNRYISCAFEEYQAAINDEIPERLLKHI